jgi:hypothetical protein
MKTSTARVKEALNVRKYPAIPATGNNVAGSLRTGDTVTVYDDHSETDSERTWRYITTAKLHGWVAGEFLTTSTTPAPVPPPIVIPAPAPTPPATDNEVRVCPHAFYTVKDNLHIKALRECKARGKPLAAMVLVKTAKPWSSDVKIRDLRAISETTEFAHRIVRDDEGSEIDWSDPNTGTKYATRYYERFLLGEFAAGYDMEDADIDILINEPPKQAEPNYFDPVIHARFWNQVMDVVEQLYRDKRIKKQRRLALFCISERNPQHAFWNHSAIQALLDRAMGRGDVIAIHNYVIAPRLDPRNAQGNCYEWDYTDFQREHLYRAELVIENLAPRHKGIQIWITEAGDINYLRCGVDHFKRGLKALVAFTRRFPTVKMFVWTWDTGGQNEQHTDAGGANVAVWTPEYIEVVTA